MTHQWRRYRWSRPSGHRARSRWSLHTLAGPNPPRMCAYPPSPPTPIARASQATPLPARPGIPAKLTALRTAFPNSRAWLCALRARCSPPARTSQRQRSVAPPSRTVLGAAGRSFCVCPLLIPPFHTINPHLCRCHIASRRLQRWCSRRRTAQGCSRGAHGRAGWRGAGSINGHECVPERAGAAPCVRVGQRAAPAAGRSRSGLCRRVGLVARVARV